MIPGTFISRVPDSMPRHLAAIGALRACVACSTLLSHRLAVWLAEVLADTWRSAAAINLGGAAGVGVVVFPRRREELAAM